MPPVDLNEEGERADGASTTSVGDTSAFPTRRSLREAAQRAAASSALSSAADDAVAVIPAATPVAEKCEPEASVAVSVAEPALDVAPVATAPAVPVAPRPSRGLRLPPAPPRTGSRRRVAATLLIVPALVGTLALPAYAAVKDDVDFASSEQFSLSVADAQDIDVSGLATEATVSRDTYTAVSAAEIEEATALAEQAAREQAAREAAESGQFAQVGVQAEGDDYPWWNETPDDFGGGLSPLRYYYRECVDFVAWRLNRDAGVTSAPWKWDWSNLASGSAYAWADAWYSKGWPVSSDPVVGAVAWFNYNHVAYVQSIPGDGTVVIEEYNQNSDHSYHRRTIPIGEAIYLYPPA
ncbi:CHAP domain-containing protein [Agromyces atrinae]|uniref:CHAP domain-containing protein n=1 Tax=Agromyces atrinae TaxID=592376 RepID=UPI001F5953D9|nr:CHAP domain-containing protein [Agromyces atrinae]MCI2959565.1 CHAP domain-containing protein [Agromyces atrinae]